MCRDQDQGLHGDILMKIILTIDIVLMLLITFQFLLIAGLVLLGARAEAGRGADDETIQAFVLRRAQRLGYGLRIIPRVKELIFGRSSSKSSKPSHSKSITNIREKRKLVDFRRPSRVTSHSKNQNRPPRNVSDKSIHK